MTIPQENLALCFIKDHEKLDKIFADLERSLQEIISFGLSPDDVEFLEEARDDLSFALDEMLEHFGIEEEAIFQQIRASLPDLSCRLESLETSHEFLCKQTSTLRKLIAAAREGQASLDVDEVLKLIQLIQGVLVQHNTAEIKVFLEALERLDPEGQRQLKDSLDRL
jgi:hemerythrin superfamily protein